MKILKDFGGRTIYKLKAYSRVHSLISLTNILSKMDLTTFEENGSVKFPSE